MKYRIIWSSGPVNGSTQVTADERESALEKARRIVRHDYDREIEEYRIEGEDEDGLDDYWYPDGE